MKTTVEAQIKEERTIQQQPSSDVRDFAIRYVDGENEQINVSDDEDLLTAYDVASKELNGNLKLVVEFKKNLNQSVIS